MTDHTPKRQRILFMAERHTVYFLKCKDDTLYTGYTNNLPNRLRMHEKGQGAKYTRGRGLFQVIFTRTFSTKRHALRSEERVYGKTIGMLRGGIIKEQKNRKS